MIGQPTPVLLDLLCFQLVRKSVLPAKWETWVQSLGWEDPLKGYQLQYSGLENSMDCISHGVSKSQTWVRDFFIIKKKRCTQQERKKKFPTKLIISCNAFSVIPTLLPPICVNKATFFIKMESPWGTLIRWEKLFKYKLLSQVVKLFSLW